MFQNPGPSTFLRPWRPLISNTENQNSRLTYSSNDGNTEVEKPEDGSEDPDVDDGEDGEDEAPDESGGNGEDGGEESVEPELGVGEQDEGELPDAVKALSAGGFGQNVVETQLKKKLKFLSNENEKVV